MRSFVRCPSCQRRLMVATDREGGRMRCPRCLMRFVLGSRVNPGSAGPAEFLAFELFDEENDDDEIEVLDDESPVDPQPSRVNTATAPTARPASDHPIPEQSPRSSKRRHAPHGENY